MRGVFLIAKVAVSSAIYSFDCEYSYRIPDEYKVMAKAGVRVLVPFGKGNRKTVGFITRLYEETEFDEKIKPVIKIIDEESLLTDEMLSIIMWLKENTFCTYFDAFKSVVPSGYTVNVTQRYTLANKSINEDELDDDELDIVKIIKYAKNQREVDRILDYTGKPKLKKLITSLIDKGILEESNVLKRKTGDETVRMVRLSDEYIKGEIVTSFTVKQKNVVDFLQEIGRAHV